MHPLLVLLKRPVVECKVAAESFMNSLKAHSNALAEEALMVSSELIRVAICGWSCGMKVLKMPAIYIMERVMCQGCLMY
jgi:hypothetical protein